jgi:hypothetical protein
MTGETRTGADIEAEVLKHRYVYVPWVSGLETVETGKALGLHAAKQHRARLTVVATLKSNAEHHAELAKLPIVSERSGGVSDGGVVLAWCPSYKVMDKVRGLEKSAIILVEWPTESYAGWAKLVGAYNVVTGEVMESGLSEAGMKALEGIAFEGYKGWHDDIAIRLTRARLEELRELREYDRELVLAYVRIHRGQYGIDRLEKVLDRFEAQYAIA